MGMGQIWNSYMKLHILIVMNKHLFFFTILFVFSLRVDASHAHAGHISYTEIGPMMYEITLVTYSDPSPAAVDRCTADLEIWNANGTIKIADLLNIPRSNGPMNIDSLYPSLVTCPGGNMGEYVRGTLKRNEYITSYTLPNSGTFLIRHKDQSRVDNITNMSFSGVQTFFIESKLVSNNLLGPQNSVRFLNHQYDQACVGKKWTFNPGLLNLDGDELQFEFVDAQQYDPPSIPTPITCTGFQRPGAIAANLPMIIDPGTGLITWTPQVVGVYAFAVKIKELRDGIEIGSTIYDQVVFVGQCSNNPPQIACPTDTVVTQGDTLRIPFVVWDDDPTDTVTFMLNNAGLGLNGAFLQSPPPTLSFSPSGTVPYQSVDTIRGTIEWIIDNSISIGFPHQIDLYAVDNYSYLDSSFTEQLSRHHALQITVQQMVGTIDSQTSSLSFELWPQPSQGQFDVIIGERESFRLEVMDITGKVVHKAGFPSSSGKVDTGDLPSGLYWIRVETRSGKSAIRKLLLNK